VTTPRRPAPGDHVNLEADLIAKHLERLAGFGPRGEATSPTADDASTAAGSAR
jgi:riboflavin synthase alpha subunit